MDIRNSKCNELYLSSTNFWLRDIAQTIHEVFSDQGYKISVRDMPDWALSLAAKINKSAKFVSSSVGKVITYDTKNVSAVKNKVRNVELVHNHNTKNVSI